MQGALVLASLEPSPEIRRPPHHPGAGTQGEDPVLVREAGLRLERLRSPAELDQAFRLRHRLFAETLHWVPEHPSGLEIDEYDSCTELIGILDAQRRLLGLVRMHESSVPFMIEREFATVLGSNAIPFKARDTAEITRFGLDPQARAQKVWTRHGCFDLFTLLLKGIYRWSVGHGVRTVFAVVDHRVFRLLHLRGFPFEALAEPKVMPDGVVALAIRLDWARFQEENQARRPGLLAWFEQDRDAEVRAVPAGPVSAPWPPPGADSPHPASAEYSRCGS